MKTLIISSHPAYEQSLSQRFLTESAQLEEVDFYLIDKEETIDFPRVMQKINDAQRIILQFPLYWYSVPAKMKLWIDTIWSQAKENLWGKELGFAVSTGVAAKEFQLGGKEKHTLTETLRPLAMMGQSYQMRLLPIYCLDQLMYKSEADKKACLIRYQQFLTMPYPFDFSQQQKWFVKRLQELPLDAPQLMAIITEIQENLETLEELDEALDSLEENK